MAQANRQSVYSLLLYLIFTLWITSVLGDQINHSLHALSIEKRVRVPPIPSVADALKHLKKPAKGPALFYKSEVQVAATEYARANNLWLIGDADDGSGWANFEGGPFMVYTTMITNDLPTWSSNELTMAKAAVCNAYAHNAHGDTIVILPYDAAPRVSFWDGEFEMLKKNPKVDKILAYDMKDGTKMPQGQPRELWPREQPKTEHAG
ncbi:hypothetical protein CNMCM8980_010347 [Aspergillus fumigatiaffinis]|jgi:hypothetical protein|uniref:SCP domain-containing protein n=1 Tax=Aspergillus fumigatiaffinis TaxID=340414 RepID=A0A8H4MHV5_9EURO|nr:hypothetical protein CNMCM5878_008309 [Aspergillus fumigatiaffinis]KAF4244011.1 hypothetical protein CNMCM8980_010347 [Aspergillus fumigatiaffinis]KAF4245033.1 hypothetical protein CNMCM6805_006466 [Aspergillus fumigatiaffinis]